MRLQTVLSTSLTLFATGVTFTNALPSPNPEPTQEGHLSKRQTYTDYFGPITELRYCANPFNIVACLAAHGHADVASRSAQDWFPQSSLHNGAGDAYRHCYWNARMAIDLGAARAKTIADNHEADSQGPASEIAMDLANNASGRAIGLAAPGATKEARYDSSEVTCRTQASNGTLVTLK